MIETIGQQVILLQAVQLAKENFKEIYSPGLYKAVSHPYSFVKTQTFSNLPIAMVFSLLPMAFRILVAASCGEVIAACSYETVATLRSDVVTWSLVKERLNRNPKWLVKCSNQTWHYKQSLLWLLKWGVFNDMLDCQRCSGTR